MVLLGNIEGILICVPIGFLLKSTCRTYQSKQFSTAIVGILLIFALCGFESHYFFFATFVNIGIIKCLKRYVGLSSLVFCFLFHLYVKYVTQLDTVSPGVVHTVQMLSTLRLSGLAFDVQDHRTTLKQGEKQEGNHGKFQLGLEREPTAFEMFCFSFCYLGIFTGPSFRYRTYYDFLHQLWRPYSTKEFKSEWWPRIFNFLWLHPWYFSLAHFFSFENIASDFFAESSIFVRYFYMIGTGLHYRSQFELAWMYAEFHCVIVGFGAYPKASKPIPGNGPTVKLDDSYKSDETTEYSYDTIRQVLPLKCETSTSLKHFLRTWNMTTQWWMYYYVYRKLNFPIKQVNMVALSIFVVLYHGFYFSYFVTFVSAVGIVLADIMVEERTKENPINPWILSLISMRITDYIQVTLVLQTWDVVMRFYMHMWFIPSIFVLSLFGLNLLFPKKTTKKID